MPKNLLITGLSLIIFGYISLYGQNFNDRHRSIEQLPLNEQITAYLDLSLASFEKNTDQAIFYAQKALALSEKEKNYKLACLCLNQLGEIYNYKQDFKSEQDCYKKGLEYASLIGDNKEKYQFYFSLGALNKSLSDFNSSIQYYLMALEVTESLADKSHLPNLLNNIGISYFKLSKYEEALKYYFKALSLKETKENKVSVARTLINIGSVYTELRNFPKALNYYKQSLKETEGANLKNLRSIIFNNIGNIYFGQEEYVKAIENHEKSLRIRIDITDKMGIGSAYNNIGIDYESLGRYNIANDYYKKALNQYETLGDIPGIATTLRNLGNITIKLGDLPLAESYLTKALDLAEKNNLVNLKADIYYSYTIFYSIQGRHKESDRYYYKQIHLKDSLNNAESRERVAQLQVLYDTEKKDRENKLLRLENEKQETSLQQQKTMLLYLTIFLLLVVGLVVLIYKFYVNRKKSALILAEKNQQLTESEENLRIINATKDRFFSIISHDLRNPFASLSIIVDNLKINLYRRNYEKMDNVIISLDRSLGITKNLLSNLLEWSMTQTGRMKFEPQMLKLSELIKSSLPLYETQAASKNQKISLSLDDSIEIFADRYMVDTVMRNLVTNAIKFTPRSGNVSIVTIRKNGHAEVSVIDNGIGIPSDTIDKLFRIDSQMRSRGTENEAGTGLGLILCKEFIEKNHGQIYAVSDLNKGSKFSFTLPLNKIEKENANQ